MRAELVAESLIQNRGILADLGCLDVAGMEKLLKGNAPTITKGPYSDELATVDHILPRSVVLELDNRLYNLAFMSWTKNQIKSDTIGPDEVALAWKWHALGLLSNEGLEAALKAAEAP